MHYPTNLQVTVDSGLYFRHIRPMIIFNQYRRQSLASMGAQEKESFTGHIASDTLEKTLATARPGGNFSCGGQTRLAPR